MAAATGLAAPVIFDFADFGDFLRAAVDARRQTSSAFSLRALAKRLRCSPSLLAMVARGERQPGIDLVLGICGALKLNKKETAYAEALVGFHRARTTTAQKRYAETLSTLKPRSSELRLSLDTFKLMADWYHIVVMELTQLAHFREDHAKIAAALGPTVSPTMVADSIALLERLALLGRDAKGLLRKLPERVSTTRSVPSAAIRSFHKQVMLRAVQAIERQPIDERYFCTATIPVPTKLLSEVSERIAAFRDELLAYLDERSADADEVYHLGVQFFRATATATLPSGPR